VLVLVLLGLTVPFQSVMIPMYYLMRRFFRRLPPELRPVSLGTMFFFGRFTANREMIAVGVTLSMIPVVILYLFL
jgi:ABC-type glycerol-3-phosphate transport system permease component